MRIENASILKWENAPDTITPKELSQILGIGIESARKLFDKPDFPSIPKEVIGNIGKADKEAARLYIQGIKIKNDSKNAINYLILQELQKLNKAREENNK